MFPQEKNEKQDYLFWSWKNILPLIQTVSTRWNISFVCSMSGKYHVKRKSRNSTFDNIYRPIVAWFIYLNWLNLSHLWLKNTSVSNSTVWRNQLAVLKRTKKSNIHFRVTHCDPDFRTTRYGSASFHTDFKRIKTAITTSKGWLW